ncbi:c-type cytochrome [Qipengyuania flava]|nr:c-type cytochrome [Qipengyuania flava]
MKCAACHHLTPRIHGIGPSLAGIYGNPAASREGYRYSDELSQSGLVWDAATLNAFLASPKEHVPGTKMLFRGLSDPADRAQVIALLQRY